jgi:hypothetical protein
VATVLAHADDSGGAGRRAGDLAVVTRAHVEHLCLTAFCAMVGALLVVVVSSALLGGGPRNGPLYFVLAVTAAVFLTAVPYSLCRWWHFATTGRDDWIVS